MVLNLLLTILCYVSSFALHDMRRLLDRPGPEDKDRELDVNEYPSSEQHDSNPSLTHHQQAERGLLPSRT